MAIMSEDQGFLQVLTLKSIATLPSRRPVAGTAPEYDQPHVVRTVLSVKIDHRRGCIIRLCRLTIEHTRRDAGYKLQIRASRHSKVCRCSLVAAQYVEAI